MKIGEHLYFAPGVRFNQLNVNDPMIIQHFHSRIEGYYLIPAKILAEKEDYAFPATLLLASAIDAIARDDSRPARNRERYVGWLQIAFPCLATKPLAEQFYDDFRCGLVHEARAKNGCVFTTFIGGPVFVENGIMAINPQRFAKDVFQALDNFCAKLKNFPDALKKFQNQLKKRFSTRAFVQLKLRNRI
jgi:hypothetical protein